MDDDWFNTLAAAHGSALAPWAARALSGDGFAVIAGPIAAARLGAVAEAYDRAVARADAADVRTGRSTTRVHDFVNRGPEFDALYLYPAVLAACCQVIGRPFKLSSLLARTLNARRPGQELHADFSGDEHGWPMLGFIYMVDEFRPENGATCFVPGSQGAAAIPPGRRPVPACGPAGSLIVYNGSTWHGHGANLTDAPRRSIQGAFIRRTAMAVTDWRARTRTGTLERVGPVGRYLLSC